MASCMLVLVWQVDMRGSTLTRRTTTSLCLRSAVSFLLAAISFAQPQLPCGPKGTPSYPELSEEPVVTFLGMTKVSHDWPPPACTGWTSDGFSSMVTTAARLRAPSGTELLRRIGA